MSDGTRIEWTDATWNPITGCSVVSPGCTNCYAMKLAGTRLKHHESRAGLTKESKAGPVWTGEVRFNEQWLEQPLRWTKPRMIFVCAHGDLFAEGVPDEWIDQVFAVMALAPQHTFQVLTKRPERMRDYLRRPISRIHNAVAILATRDEPNSREEFYRQWPECKIEAFIPAPVARRLRAGWPLPNVWLGVSVEDQKRADERIPILLDTPAAIRWISAEPLLGPVDLRAALLLSDDNKPLFFNPPRNHIDWVVAGGESGPGARPMHPDWVRSLRDQCKAAAVPFLFKQWGEWWEVWSEMRDENGNHLVVDADSHEASELWDEHFDCLITHDGRRFTPETLPEDTLGRLMSRIGKRATGRLLDGVEHNAFPVTGR
ncbi:phage Gp37/Gp68 family protein [Rhizobium cremeum]|uniref:phage Gp37/Gp68 family protein n=1 Tax=Rhizobium cremeum TaxID=2813827 RepID=UPI001FD1F20F|nr:phage Gp37/Gp68 family protein [Rhizobium cremeum]MCJ7996645.1 phage Gp37/Gp68 family protein [Rhizobium cremeum]MCJ7999369.1 phage Gp37/Gp68 family protein [Rhizobium cremeum]